MSTKNAATLSTTSKNLKFAGPFAAYETRSLEIKPSSGTLPGGVYKFQIMAENRIICATGLTLAANTLTGTASLATTEMGELFAVRWNKSRLSGLAYIWDESNTVLWGRGWVDILRNEYSSGQLTPISTATWKSGTQTIDEGAHEITVDLAALALADPPAQVFASVVTPEGGSALLFATCVSSTAEELVFVLPAPTPEAGYKLNWMILL